MNSRLVWLQSKSQASKKAGKQTDTQCQHPPLWSPFSNLLTWPRASAAPSLWALSLLFLTYMTISDHLLFFFFFFLVLVLVLVFQDRVSLYSRGCPGTHFVNQAGLELRSLPASASRVLGLKACATTPGSSAMSCPGDSSCFCSLSSVARREVRVQGGSLKRRNHC